MKEYIGKSKSILTLGIIISVILISIIFIAMNMAFGVLSGVLIFLLLATAIPIYRGMVLKISVNNEQIVIIRPLSRKTIKFSDIAFCAVHGIDENSSIIYAFVKKKYGSIYSVKGIKPKKSFEEIIKIVNTDNENIPLDINFNMSEKIPVSFVENSEDLINTILLTLGEYHKKILDL